MDLKEVYLELKTKVDEIDEQLDSLTDGKAAGKRATVNKFMEETQDSWKPIVDNFKAQLSAAPDETLIGIFYGITRSLTTELGSKVTETLDKIVESMPTPTPLITPDQVPELQTARSQLYANIKATINLAEQFDQAEGMEMPKKRTGSKGPRGKRALSFFTFFIEDKEYENLKAVIEDYPQYEAVKELTAAIKEYGAGQDPTWNLTDPPQEWSYTMPDGRILVGKDTRDPDENGEDDDENGEGEVEAE